MQGPTRYRACMSHAVDWPKLVEHISVAQRHRGLSDRAMAETLGLPAYSTLSRLRHGQQVSADTLATLVAWLYPNEIPAWIREVPPRAKPPVLSSE